ncbi:serine/threonine protein phosphatase [Mobiluncus sp.]|uniref:serine/threonine protein phosphatase n=1 Tax=Mobiluncus sp. TaxID=47293 RepID=UPI002A9189D6|nr:serine/threonine protein phosphatase [Mobiluncus sp.]MDY6076291.1 serine/threonine protein phosphatase [Mobiluncus sp.]
MNTLTKLIIIQAVILVIQIILYFGSERFQHVFHNPQRRLDQHIPRIPAFVYPYVLWFPLIVIFPIGLYYFSPGNWVALQIAWIFCVVISVIAYLAYPTTFQREKLGQGRTERVLALVYKTSYRGVNCAPSLHCSTSMMIAFVAVVTNQMPWWLRVISVLVSLAIILATQFTKQHVLLDLLTAIPVAAVSLSIGFPLAFSGAGASILGWLGLAF